MLTKWCVATAVLLAMNRFTFGQGSGGGGTSWSNSSPGGGSSSSSSASSSSAGGTTTSTSSISQSSAGGQVSLQCYISPGGHAIWYKLDGGSKREIARDSSLTISDTRFQLQARNGVYILTINPTRDADSGVYLCEGSALSGQSSSHRFDVKIGRGNGAAGRGASFGAGAAFVGTMLLFA